MLLIRIIIYSCIFISSSLIGIMISRKYANRVSELKDFRTALNMFKTKVRYTYEPVPEIFKEISSSITSNIGNVFRLASNNMKLVSAGKAWEMSLDSSALNITEEDKNSLKNLGKQLGKTDLDGQVKDIEVTQVFLEEQIIKAEAERIKSEKMYRSLGMVIGLAIVIILL